MGRASRPIRRSKAAARYRPRPFPELAASAWSPRVLRLGNQAQAVRTQRGVVEKPVAEHWYAIKPLDAKVVWIREIHVDPYVAGDIWLLRGSERDLVVDTGMGVVPPAEVIEALTTKPVVAIAMNCYFDHAGGWYNFAERLCHPLDAEALRDPSEESALASDYLTDEALSALPRPGYATSGYRMHGAAPTGLVEEGNSIDLGDRALEVLHLPGRSPGGIALWEPGSGSLFTSDMLYDGPSGAAWPPDEPAAYCESLRRLLKLPVRRVHPGHYGPFDAARMAVLIEAQLADLATVQHSDERPDNELDTDRLKLQ